MAGRDADDDRHLARRDASDPVPEHGAFDPVALSGRPGEPQHHRARGRRVDLVVDRGDPRATPAFSADAPREQHDPPELGTREFAGRGRKR